MRIIAGQYKNRKIDTPHGQHTRPILSRVRKSLFDILQPYMDESRMLDLFSGTGIMALEAFSRGASFVYSIDLDIQAVHVAQRNHQRICPDKPYRVVKGDVLHWIPLLTLQEEPFDIIGITPPYGHDYGNQSLSLIDQYPHWLKPETVLYVQHGEKESIQLDWNNLEHVRSCKYGKTRLAFFMPFEKPPTPDNPS